MKNNLDEMIQRAKLKKKDVAELKGVTPETVSRHIHGRIPMTTVDLAEYAKICGCKVQDILLANEHVPVLISCHIMSDGRVVRSQVQGKFCSGKGFGDLFDHSAAVCWSLDKRYNGKWLDWTDCLEFVLVAPMKEMYISEFSYNTFSYVMLEKPAKIYPDFESNLVAGNLFREPGGTNRIYNQHMDLDLPERKILWATPVIATFRMPKHCGISVT